MAQRADQRPSGIGTIELTHEDAPLEWSQRTLASAVSHQLRGPLTVMRGILETLARMPDLDVETRSELIGRALAAEARQERLIETLLDRRGGAVVDGIEDADESGDAGVLTPRSVAKRFLARDVGLREAVRRVVQETLTPEERWRVVIDVPDGVYAYVDPVALDCVVSNLVSNAIGYSPAGAPVEVMAEQHGDEVVVVVEDAGPGVAPEDRERIFEPYQRSSHVAGVGLGLAIARWAVDSSGGRIWVESEDGAGARFSFTLPAAGT